MVPSMNLTEILSELGDGARLEVVADTGSFNSHRSATDSDISFAVRLLGIHTVLHVRFIERVSKSVGRVGASDPTAPFTDVSMRDSCHVEAFEAFGARALALDFFLYQSWDDFVLRPDCHALF